jgi:hypothetical protein
MVLAHWVNLSVIVLVAPLALLRRRPVMRPIAVTISGVGGGAALTRLSPYHTTMAILPAAEWPHGWYGLLANASQAFPHRAALGAVAMLGAIAAVIEASARKAGLTITRLERRGTIDVFVGRRRSE